MCAGHRKNDINDQLNFVAKVGTYVSVSWLAYPTCSYIGIRKHIYINSEIGCYEVALKQKNGFTYCHD
jgi:hypothetical protein